MGTASLACAILSTLMVIVFPAETKRIIDEVLNQHRAEQAQPLVLIAVRNSGCRIRRIRQIGRGKPFITG